MNLKTTYGLLNEMLWSLCESNFQNSNASITGQIFFPGQVYKV